jgi:hypothetical protein
LEKIDNIRTKSIQEVSILDERMPGIPDQRVPLIPEQRVPLFSAVVS